MIINEKIIKAEQNLKTQFAELEEIALYNQNKVINAFKEHNIALRHFVGSTGYGYDDTGRDTLAKVFAAAMGAEMAIVSPYMAGASHALKIALYGLLRPNDTLLSITGKPYDTLDEVIWGEGNGSLKDFGVNYTQVELLDNGEFDLKTIEIELKKQPKVVYFQRSRGYSSRDSLSVDKIAEIISFVRQFSKDSFVFVDNCYCEFVEKQEPTDVGADVIVGSLMKNPGGGIVPNGAYIAGTERAIDQIAGSFTSPSIKLEVCSYEQGYRLFYQGLFMGPHITLQALKSSMLFGKVLGDMGFETLPKPGAKLTDITRSIILNTKENMVAFCKAIQHASPVDSFVDPIPYPMPGYTNDVVMAAGAFVQGSSIELSCDGPIKPPYTIYMQGGLTYEHCKLALNECLSELENMSK